MQPPPAPPDLASSEQLSQRGKSWGTPCTAPPDSCPSPSSWSFPVSTGEGKIFIFHFNDTYLNQQGIRKTKPESWWWSFGLLVLALRGLGLPPDHHEGGTAPAQHQGALMHFWGIKGSSDTPPPHTPVLQLARG
ncbi:unnamed protein product [Rangifer tarandus platyrhynchus]|uniref:Uncharacterized protein n=1 Tax=Rangifer tarandus platyrhynchus TaxID=3082113 RepID=A0ABN8YQL8_RANTA|nr:unnamed protein product [Rangifer tarandus platyrhynchus]